jgi:DNA repair protein RadC
MGVHDGHRERLKANFAENGLDGFNDLNALELLLFYAIPRRDTNVIAHELINRFGSLDGVFNASLQELMDVPGIGENAALLIRLVPQMAKKRELSKVSNMKEFCRSSEVAKFLIPRFINERDEVAMVVCLDTQNCLLCCEVLNHGDVKSVDISVRRLVETALKHKASAVVLAHNHPDGALLPSREDEVFTNNARDALRLLEIRMMDHLIIAGNRYFSMKDSNMFGRF